MKIEHRILATLLVVMLSCGLLTGCGGSEQESVTLTVAHVLNETHPYHLAWLKVAELVEERTDGGLRLEVFANGTLGNERDIIEGMQRPPACCPPDYPKAPRQSHCPALRKPPHDC